LIVRRLPFQATSHPTAAMIAVTAIAATAIFSVIVIP